MLCRVRRARNLRGRYGTYLRNVVYLASLGLAVHLILPQIPGLERSARLVAEASPLLVGAAFVAELDAADRSQPRSPVPRAGRYVAASLPTAAGAPFS